MHYGLSFRVGWEYEQEWDDDATTIDVLPRGDENSNVIIYDFDGEYKWGVELYGEMSGGFAFLLNIDKFWYNLVEFTTEEF